MGPQTVRSQTVFEGLQGNPAFQSSPFQGTAEPSRAVSALSCRWCHRPWLPCRWRSSWRIHLGSEYQTLLGSPCQPLPTPFGGNRMSESWHRKHILKAREGDLPRHPQACTLFVLEEANKRPQTAQEGAAAPGPAGLQRRRGRGALASSLWEAFLLSQPCGGCNRPVLGLWGMGQSHGPAGTFPQKGHAAVRARAGGDETKAGELRPGPPAVPPCGAGT